MRRPVLAGLAAVISLACCLSAAARQTNTSAATTTAQESAVPRVIQFGGVVKDANGTPQTGSVSLTFMLYESQDGGTALWSETQSAELDAQGHYTVLLGANTAGGLPLDLFTAVAARWLGVQPQIPGFPEQPRVLLVGVPYAMKAADADTLGGLPAAAFVQQASGQPGASTGGTKTASSAARDSGAANPPTLGTKNYIPVFTGGTPLAADSIMYQAGGNSIGIGTVTPAATLEVNGAARFDGLVTFSSGQTFPGTATLGANTFGATQTIGSGNLALPQTTGSSAGVLTLGGNPFLHACCSAGQQNMFAGFLAGNFTTTGGQNTASGYGALGVNTTGSNNTASGTFALSNNSTGNSNTASGVLALESNTTGSYNTASGHYSLLDNTTGVANTGFGFKTLYFNTTGNTNTATGYGALFFNTTGSNNMASGGHALESNTTGIANAASGFEALYLNTTGSYNAAGGHGALESNSTGNYNAAIGYFAGCGNNCGGANTTGSYNTFIGAWSGLGTSAQLSNATAIGAYAAVTASNALVLGGIKGVNGATANTFVGIGTTAPSNVFTIAQGAGVAISDGWNTYSSRRWKTNIQTLRDSLEKVEQLRGVSYDLRSSGRHEIGVIAEEVGAVLPEVVEYEPNGTDARAVDYSRLTAVLIEAVKEQQTLIQAQRSQLKLQQTEIGQLASQVRLIQASLRVKHGKAPNVSTSKARVPTASATGNNLILAAGNGQ